MSHMTGVPSQPTSIVDLPEMVTRDETTLDRTVPTGTTELTDGRAASALGSSRPVKPRLRYLDALRGIGLLLVLTSHVGGVGVPWLRRFCTETVALGPGAVMMFFACSGFIIPVALERAGDLRAFWVSRFMRLYPMYWLSLALAAVLVAFGRYAYLGPQGPTAATTWLADVTMLQMFVGQPNVLIIYWTLAWEMLFYLLLSVMFVVGIHRRSVMLSLACNGLILAAVAAAAVAGRADSLPLGTMALVFAFLGAVWYRWTVGEVSGRVLAAVVGAAAMTVTVFSLVVLHVEGPPDLYGEHRWPMLTGWLGGMAIFSLVVFWGSKGRRVPGVLWRLGTISYSVYLLQAIVIAVFPLSDSVPVWVSVSIWVVGTLALSALTYRWIEKTGLSLGRRWSRRWRRTPSAAPVAAQ